MDKTRVKDFQYTHNNPYHDKLDEFSEFVMKTPKPRFMAGKWGEEVFKREGPLCLEIGSGYGHFMMEYCEKNLK